jgi:hypothetical protein
MYHTPSRSHAESGRDDGLLIPPQPLELNRRKLGVADRVPNVLVAEIGLDRPGIGAVVGQLEAAGVAQHVGVDLEAELGGLTCPFNQFSGSLQR